MLKRARPAQLLELVTLCLSNARLIRPTYRATKTTVSLADAHFGITHRKNTPANAFRHGLWNWMIARECHESVGDMHKVLSWTERITDMHEKILPGSALANAMDLHNNAVGRSHFKTNSNRDLEVGVDLFLGLAQTSVLVRSLKDIATVPESHFVHLIELNS